MDRQDESSPPETPPKSRAKSCLKIALIVGFLGLLVCGGILAAVGHFVVQGMKSIGPYQMALQQVRQSPEVIERLGEPVEDATFVPSAQINVQNGQGSASIEFKVAGPNGKADVHCQGRMVNDIWGLTDLTVTFADGEKIAVSTGEALPDDAPIWTPPTIEPQAEPENLAPPQIELQLPQGILEPPGN